MKWPKPISERAAKAEAKRIHEFVLAMHGGEPHTRPKLIEVVEELEKGREVERWAWVAAFSIQVFGPHGPEWPLAKKRAYVEAARETHWRVREALQPYIEVYKKRFVESAAEWARKYGSRKYKRKASVAK